MIDFSSQRLLVVGDVMLDEYVWGECRRISAEAPVPVVEIGRRSYRPGGAANVAANVVSLGGSALLVGVTGRDREAQLLRGEIAALGVSPEGLLADTGRPTTTKTRVIAFQQQVVRLDAETRAPLSSAREASALKLVRRHFGSATACVISDYQKGMVTASLAEAVIGMARRAGVPVVIDPKSRDFSIYRGATVVTPNVSEAGRAANRELNGDADLEHVTRFLLRTLSGSALLVTRGAEGMSLFRPDRAPLHIPAVARTVFDVTGAGDTAVSALALCLGAGVRLEDAARVANAAAGIVVGKVGTECVAAAELEEALDEIAREALPPAVGA